MSSGPSMKFGCPFCDQCLSASPELFGQSLACPNCSNMLTIPHSGSAVHIQDSETQADDQSWNADGLDQEDDALAKYIIESGQFVLKKDYEFLQNGYGLINKAVYAMFGGEGQFRQVHEDLLYKVAEGNVRSVVETDYEPTVLKILAEAYAQVIGSALTNELFLNFVSKSIKPHGYDTADDAGVHTLLSSVLCDAAERAVQRLDYSRKEESEDYEELPDSDWD